MLEFYTKKTVKAKIKHTCTLCRSAIEVGEEYVVYKGKTSYGWFFDLYHPTCQKIIDEFLDDNGVDEYDEESIEEWLCDSRCHNCDKYDRANGECASVVLPLDCPKIKNEFREATEEE